MHTHAGPAAHVDWDKRLLAAAAKGDRKNIRLALGEGASVDARQRRTGSTALHLASAGGHQAACTVLLKAIVAPLDGDKGARKDALLGAFSATNAAGHTPAQGARDAGHPRVAEYLDSKTPGKQVDRAIDRAATRDGTATPLVSIYIPM